METKKHSWTAQSDSKELVRGRYHMPSLERALKILEFLAKHPNGQSMIEIAEALRYPNNSVFRITMTLLDIGYLYRDKESKRFVLTRKMLAVGYEALSEDNLVEKALDVMRELRDATRETVLLGTMGDDDGVIIEQVPGSYPFKFILEIGWRFPLHAGAPGKAILAFLPPAECERILARIKLTRYNERTITTKEAFREELRRVREDGYAVDRAEMLEGSHCVGAPVLNRQAYPTAAIWATGPVDRMPESAFDAIGRQVREHAARISRRLGYGLL